MIGEPSKGMGFGFSEEQMSNLESNPELYDLTTGMEMLAFPSKTRDANSLMWKEYFTKQPLNHAGSSSSTGFYQGAADHEFHYKTDFNPELSETTTDNLIHSSWQHNNTNNRSFLAEESLPCVFPPYEGREGLSLSLSSQRSSSSSTQLQHQRHQPQGYMGIGSNLHQTHCLLKDSKYLEPCQQILNEFCSLGTKKTPSRFLKKKINQWQDDDGASSSTKKPSFHSLDIFELQKRKSKLVSMLDEVDKRYKLYCEQMKCVVSSFDAVVGNGAGMVYSALASKAMSRHFRCLRDAITSQIKDTNKAMGEKDPVAPGTTKGETPRLRLLDQTHRQERAFRQMSVIESRPWRPQRGLPERSVSLLRAWLFEHFLHPYPSDVDKHILARQTGLSRSQVSNWFINARVRLWKPMVEEMYLEESKELGPSDRATGRSDNNSAHLHYKEQKPTPDQLIRGDTGSLSSIINNDSDKIHLKSVRNQNEHHHQHLGKDSETFGVMDLDFSSYNNNGVHQNFGNGVSLTLGLQQHGEIGSGMNISFATPSQNSLFFPRGNDENCEQLQYSILDGEVQNPPYRNLMGVQLLHDLAG